MYRSFSIPVFLTPVFLTLICLTCSAIGQDIRFHEKCLYPTVKIDCSSSNCNGTGVIVSSVLLDATSSGDHLLKGSDGCEDVGGDIGGDTDRYINTVYSSAHVIGVQPQYEDDTVVNVSDNKLAREPENSISHRDHLSERGYGCEDSGDIDNSTDDNNENDGGSEGGEGGEGGEKDDKTVKPNNRIPADFKCDVLVGIYHNHSKLKGYDRYEASLDYVDYFNDTCILTFISDRPMPCVEIYSGDLFIGSELLKVGCGLGDEPRLDKGFVSSVGPLNEPGIIRGSIFSVPGDSGGPLFHNYQLIGLLRSVRYMVTDGGLRIPASNIAYIVPVRWYCREYIEASGGRLVGDGGGGKGEKGGKEDGGGNPKRE